MKPCEFVAAVGELYPILKEHKPLKHNFSKELKQALIEKFPEVDVKRMFKRVMFEFTQKRVYFENAANATKLYNLDGTVHETTPEELEKWKQKRAKQAVQLEKLRIIRLRRSQHKAFLKALKKFINSHAEKDKLLPLYEVNKVVLPIIVPKHQKIHQNLLDYTVMIRNSQLARDFKPDLKSPLKALKKAFNGNLDKETVGPYCRMLRDLTDSYLAGKYDDCLNKFPKVKK